MFPRSGGVYVFLREAYGPLPAFLYGWAALFVVISGGIAAVAVGFAEYLSYFVPAASPEAIILSLETRGNDHAFPPAHRRGVVQS